VKVVISQPVRLSYLYKIGKFINKIGENRNFHIDSWLYPLLIKVLSELSHIANVCRSMQSKSILFILVARHHYWRPNDIYRASILSLCHYKTDLFNYEIFFSFCNFFLLTFIIMLVAMGFKWISLGNTTWPAVWQEKICVLFWSPFLFSTASWFK